MEHSLEFNLERILALSKQILPKDTLENISQYNDEMTISQVVRFFERQGLDFTKTMIQNYVRVGVIPPPVDKRYYVKNHLILLTLIHNLKGIFSLDEIRRLIHAISRDIDTFEDDMIDMAVVYDIYTEMYHAKVERWEKELPALFRSVRERVDNSKRIHTDEKDPVYFFITALTLMAQSIATKQLARLLLDTLDDDAK